MFLRTGSCALITHRRDGDENRAQVPLRQDRDRGRHREEDDEPHRARLNRENPRLDKEPDKTCRKHQAAPDQLDGLVCEESVVVVVVVGVGVGVWVCRFVLRQAAADGTRGRRGEEGSTIIQNATCWPGSCFDIMPGNRYVSVDEKDKPVKYVLSLNSSHFKP